QDIVAEKIGVSFEPFWFAGSMNPQKIKNPKSEWNQYPLLSIDGERARPQMPFPLSSYAAVVRKGYEHPEAIVKAVNIMNENYWGQSAVKFTKIDKDPKYVEIGAYPFLYTIVYQEPPTINLDLYNQISDAVVKKDPSGIKSALGQTFYPLVMKYLNEGDNGQWLFNEMFGPGGAVAIQEDYLKNSLVQFNQFYGPPTPTMADKQVTMVKMEDVAFTKIIMGEAPIDDFDKFVAQWKTTGGDTITQEVNAWSKKNQ
ncbi:MAG: hypothetical protein Q7K45_03870, partial [Nanoarchaeota archaeon]|nr:hypothetical protein [Nanoarchaeota archaeon]